MPSKVMISARSRHESMIAYGDRRACGGDCRIGSVTLCHFSLEDFRKPCRHPDKLSSWSSMDALTAGTGVTAGTPPAMVEAT
jgi:hypothetical protein